MDEYEDQEMPGQITRAERAKLAVDAFGEQFDQFFSDLGEAGLRPSVHARLHRMMLADGVEMQAADDLLDALVDRAIEKWKRVISH